MTQEDWMNEEMQPGCGFKHGDPLPMTEQTQLEQSVREADPLVRTVTFDFAQRIARLFEGDCPVTVVEAKGEHAVVRLGDEEWGYEYTISVRKSA